MAQWKSAQCYKHKNLRSYPHPHRKSHTWPLNTFEAQNWRLRCGREVLSGCQPNKNKLRHKQRKKQMQSWVRCVNHRNVPGALSLKAPTHSPGSPSDVQRVTKAKSHAASKLQVLSQNVSDRTKVEMGRGETPHPQHTHFYLWWRHTCTHAISPAHREI